jgi:hypothetical protein
MPSQKIRTEANQIAKVSKTTFDFKEINVNSPAPTDWGVRRLIDELAKELRLSKKVDAEWRRSQCAGESTPHTRRHGSSFQRRRHQPLAQRIFATK